MIVFGGVPVAAGVLSEADCWPQDCLTVDEASGRLGVSPQRVRYLLARCKLRGALVRVGGRQVWAVHESLRRRVGKAGRPAIKHRQKGGAA